MKTQIPQSTISQYESMGFQAELIKMAWESCNNESELLETLFTLSSQNQVLQQGSPNKQDEEMALNQALLESYKTNPQTTSFEIVSPEQRLRQDGIPCGLKNVGNTCYFNGLLQTYFYNSEFVRIILQYQPTKQTQSVKLVQNLQNLFLSMIGSDKKYVDPSEVVKSICDDFGNVLPIGDQKDVGEFNHYFLSRIGEGLICNDQDINDIQEQPQQQSSILRQKSSTIHDEDIISKLFFTKAYKQLEFDQAGVPQKREGSELFNFIPLDIKDGNLYDSFDGFIINSVEDFKNDLSEIVHATTYNWISIPPQTLSFQIQRVNYSKEKGELIKQNDEFLFDEEIYLDRFLIDNSKEYLDIRKKNSEYKNKQRKIKLDQHQLIKFNEQYDLQDVLNTVIKFLQLQSQNENIDNIANFGKVEDKKTITQLQQYQNQVQNRKQVLQKQYDDYEEKIQSQFNNLKKHKYVLQSILIHEGMANSGHYYTYIKDFSLNKWFKFNDVHVTEISKEKVFQDAIGTKIGTNAYLLVYVKDNVQQQEQNNIMRTYKISSHNDYLKDVYGSYLSKQQIQSITQENQLFQNEIEDFKWARIIDRVCESYQTRFEFVNEHFRVLSNKHQNAKFKPFFTLNLPLFLKSKSLLTVPINVSDNLLKWIILDSAIRDSRDDKIGLYEDKLSQNFKDKLAKKFSSQFTEYKRPRASLTTIEQIDLVKYQQEYVNYIQVGSITQILNETLLNQQFLNSIQMLYHLCKIVKMGDSNSYFYKVASNLSKVVPLIIIGSMIQKISNDDVLILQVLQTYLIDQYSNFSFITFWDPQISIMLHTIYENHNIQQIQQIIQNFESKIITKEYQEILTKLPNELGTRIESYVAMYDINFWSPYQKEDLLFEKLMDAQNQIKVKFDVFLKLHQKLKTAEFPLMKEELEEMIKLYKI